MKITHKRILRENSKKILTKSFVTAHYVKDVLQNDDDVIRECHKTKISKYLEVRRTEDLIWWKCNLWNCHKKIQQYIVKYNFCQQNKINCSRQYNKVTQLNALDASWTLIIMNFIMKLSSSRNFAWDVTFDSILTIIN